MAESMTAPDSVRICGKVYKVKAIERNALGADRAGEASHQHLVITYDTSWALAQQKDTVLHEVLHCCEHAAGLELEEHTIASLATLLYGVAQDNPQLWKWLGK